MAITDTKFDDSVTYTCKDGYETDDSLEIICLDSGDWSDAPPTCEKKGEFPEIRSNCNGFKSLNC